jgi:sulfite reductase (NADPH) flavoprotein alpha-component
MSSGLPDVSAARLAGAALAAAAWAALCAATAWRGRRRRRAASAAGAPVLVVHASQTGTAAGLAQRSAQALRGGGLAARVVALGDLEPATLASARLALFVASTCGEGDAPDAAAPFVRGAMAASPPPDLARLRFAVLALGDRRFADFCAFGRRLEDWLRAAGAQALFERLDADGLDAATLDRWQHELGRLASLDGPADLGSADAPSPARWRLESREQVNAGSAGAPVYRLVLAPPPGAAPHWESGDLAQLHAPGDPRPRTYSIASVADDGRMHLLVRQARRPDGTLGAASGWLTRGARIGDDLTLGLRPHPGFRLDGNAARPLILVGNGTGIAGLRGHLRARQLAQAGPNWLVFGERESAFDFHFRDEIESWRAGGLLARLDLAFSRDQARKVYVQDRLRAAAAELRAWIGYGAAIYVCGSLRGMAAGVEEALEHALGRETLDALIAGGRYRRDVY